ncbi:hypothetical protein Tco_0143826 [Tanacetum coccineum]
MQAARDRQKSYADLKRKPIDFQVGDKVMLKFSWKGLELPEELSRVHNTFHVSNLKKCHADEPLAVPLDGLHFDDKLQFVEEPIKIMDREVKRLKRSHIPLVKYVPDPMELEDHVPVYIPELEHPEGLVPAEDEAPIETYITEHHPLLPLSTPPLLPIPLHAPSTSRRADIPEADTSPRKRLLLTTPRPRFVDTVETRVQDTERRMMDAIEVVNLRVSHQADVHRRESSELAYEQESIETRQALARSEAYSRALEARITVLETQARRHEWQRQDADDRATGHIMRIQALEAGACNDTLEDTGSSA